MSVTDKPDGRSNASLRTDTIDTRRRPVYVPKSVTAEIPKSRKDAESELKKEVTLLIILKERAKAL